MTKKDFALVAAGFADVEHLIEELGCGDDAGIGASMLRLAIDSVAARIAAEHPRFSRAAFEAAATPISHERQKQAILAAFARDE